MNDFETQLRKFMDQGTELQLKEMTLKQELGLYQQKFQGFMKEHGLPENWTLAELALLAVKKSKVVETLPL